MIVKNVKTGYFYWGPDNIFTRPNNAIISAHKINSHFRTFICYEDSSKVKISMKTQYKGVDKDGNKYINATAKELKNGIKA